MKQDGYFPQSEICRVPEVWGPEECLQRCLASGFCRRGLLYDWLWGRAGQGNCQGRWGALCFGGVHRGNRAF